MKLKECHFALICSEVNLIFTRMHCNTCFTYVYCRSHWFKLSLFCCKYIFDSDDNTKIPTLSWLLLFGKNLSREISWWKQGYDVSSDIQNSKCMRTGYEKYAFINKGTPPCCSKSILYNLMWVVFYIVLLWV